MVDQLREIREVCLRLLSRREYSRFELLNKLTLRGFAKLQSEKALDGLVEQSWLSDRRYAEGYARQRLQKGYGPNRIVYELKQAGIDDFDLEGLVDETGESWLTLLVRVYDKKYSQAKKITRNEWAKRSRFLLQRGFTSTQIGALLDHLNLKFE